MAATKISALGTLAQDSITPASDLFNLVDVSDTTMGAGGTNKKATIKSTISKSLDDLAATWNNGAVDFTAIKMNVTDTASGANSLLMDLQVGGSSRFKVAKDGSIEIPNTSRFSFGNNRGIGYGTSGLLLTRNGAGVYVGQESSWGNQLRLRTDGSIRFIDGTSFPGTDDLSLFRDAANTLAQRNGVNAQEFRLYNTFTDASNYERAVIRWNSNLLQFGIDRAGTGSNRTVRYCGPNFATYMQISANSNINFVPENSGKSVDFQFTDIRMGSLPTSDPLVAGRLWNNGGIVLSSGTHTGFSYTPTWDNVATTFTAMTVNVTDTASAAGSLLFDLQVANMSRANIDKGGNLTLASHIFLPNSQSITTGAARLVFTNYGRVSNEGFQVDLANGAFKITVDCAVYRDAADTWAFRRSTNPQAINIYNTYTDASNYERLGVRWSGNVCTIGTQALGTGSGRNLVVEPFQLNINSAGSVRAIIQGGGLDLLNLYGRNLSTHVVLNMKANASTFAQSPASGFGYLYFDDNGAGKMRLMVAFPTGAAQQIAIEP